MGESRYIVVEGPIGVGKTSLVRLLGEFFQARTVLERAEENPFLSKFYGDRDKFAFQTQIFFLLTRYQQQQEILQAELFRQNILSDYLFAKDRIFAYLNLSEDERVFGVSVSCPSCNRSLMTREHLLDGQPMVRVTVSFGRKHGWMRLSSLYGDYRIESEYDIPRGAVAHFFCPQCHAELRSTGLCPNCDAPMIVLLVRGGGTVQFCSRRGCQEHMLDLGA